MTKAKEERVAGSINRNVVVWAHARLGKKIGRGECWDLLDQALRAAGAQSSTTTGREDDYVWGSSVGLNQVVPGDLLQFRNFVVTTKIEKIVRFPDGTGYRDTEEKVARRPHHSAIVHHVEGGGLFRIYEQHVKPAGDRVQNHTVPTRNSAPGQKVTHQVLKTEDGHMRTAIVETTTTVVVSGRVWAYHPQAR